MPNRTITRTKKGCFTCRLRKKKCSEERPICVGCQRNFLICNWPEYDNQTLTDFTNKKGMPNDKKKKKYEVNYKMKYITPRFHDARLKKKTYPTESKRCSSDSPHIMLNDRKPVRYLNKKMISEGLAPYNLIPSIPKPHSPENPYLEMMIFPFVNNILPEQCRIRGKNSFTYLLASSLPLSKVVISLGYSYIVNNGDSFKDLASEKHMEALGELQRSFQRLSHDEIIHDWVLISIALLMVKEESTGQSVSEFIKHLNISYYLISKRILMKHLLKSYDFRLAVDSFIYHYSTTYLCFFPEELKKLPNPFIVEKCFSLLNDELFDDNDKHPMLGRSTESFMVASQASDLLRTSKGSIENKSLAMILLAKIENMLKRLSKIHDFSSNNILPMLILNASKILLHRVINPAIKASSETIKMITEIIIHIIAENFSTDALRILGLWAVFICGICCICEEDRQIIKMALTDIRKEDLYFGKNSIHAYYVLDFVWVSDLGLDILDDVKILNSMTLS